MTPVVPAPGRVAGVMGSPIAHSLSPALHLAAYRSLGLSSWTYVVREVDEA
ncbi:MAG: shikimate dehydrogenase, partial [Actinomycetota bacterium]|nr:shikimate dehydrogenase [Actinomycetota bacterium]